MKLINSFCALLFVIFAAVQYNDPDPWLWITTYIFTSILFIAHIFNKLPQPLLLASFLFFSVWGCFFIPDFIDWIDMGAPSIASEMKTSEPHIELVREFGGLMICLVGVLFLLYQQKIKNN